MFLDTSHPILLVEDSSTDAALIQAKLRLGLGEVNVTRVESLSAAIQRIGEETFTVILLDLNLPDSAGLQTFLTLSAHVTDVPIVVLSSMEDSETAVQAVAAGADDYVQKNHFDAQTLAKSVRFAIERNNRLAAERQLLQVRNELNTAQHIQDSLYPRQSPKFDELDIGAGIRSAGMGCGDYFDFVKLNDGRYGIVVGDVSGHGMGSAIVMAETRTCLRTVAELGVDPSRMFPTMNRLIHDGTADGMFVTLLLVIYDPESATFEYHNAGHPGWILRKDHVETLVTHQIPLGLIPEVTVTTSDCFRLNPGDILLMPTDGIQESPSGSSMFGKDRMLGNVRKNRHRSADEIVDSLLEAALQYADSDTPADDMTLVVIKARERHDSPLLPSMPEKAPHGSPYPVGK